MNTETNTNKKNSTDSTKLTSVHTLSEIAPYHSDPLALFHALCGNKKHNILLESAEIDKKHQLKSLLLTDAAVKIVCQGNIVTFSPLTNNGISAVAFAASQLKEHAIIAFIDNAYLPKNSDDAICSGKAMQSLQVTFADVATDLDEKSRLMAVNPFQSLRLFNELTTKDAHPFAIFLGGVFAFDMMSLAEELPDVDDGENTCPDFSYYLAETLVIIDHEKSTTELIGNIFSEQVSESNSNNLEQHITKRFEEIKQAIKNVQQTPLLAPQIPSQSSKATSKLSQKNTPDITVTEDIDDKAYCQIVNDLKENIRAGDIFQVVPSRTFSLPCRNTINAYQALKLSNPSPYMFYLQDDDFCIFGASPESALKYQQSNRQVEIYPIAGTRPRGFTPDGQFSPDLDSRIELDLRLDKKEMAEHIMLVDLARNDIARVSQAGTRHVADLLKVDRYSHVMHLVSRVCGTLSLELDALHAYQACMNMGTLSGAPKVKATQLIREVEGKRRGSYGGAVGYITGQGEMDTCIVIRSAFVKDGIAQVQAGAGVVYDSNPQAEANETKQKAQAVINAIKDSEQSLIKSTVQAEVSSCQ